ncbi:hypothetical protein RU03_26630 [Pseudomonas simiae]|uniref:hypothetical protein n=1 Tax=Pseudomonas TaxID=286 RepID=UPI0005B6D2BA|nr:MULTISPECIES: hypothetical protein [Pseudomonas]KIQ07303.1 hypothetical protein RU03_26630 [Pseudomonas simiae]
MHLVTRVHWENNLEKEMKPRNIRPRAILVTTISASLALMILKITGIVGWSWWLITAPLWVTYLAGIIWLIAILVIASRR